ncbi:MAG: phosphoribosylformylglycinamidine synthase subunit PurQ [Alphaproteobacteria bacterium]|nr:phosphoribosylformylglycinamidine synthase subunit PurQ [Alphaproteobacteria bacterium]
MKAAVIVFPGSNCDRDAAVALEHATGAKPAMVWHRETDLPRVDAVVIPGGFSYGDYLRAGAMAAQSPVMRAVVAQAERGVPTLGICNGFQILTEAGLLPGALMRNAGLKFLCRPVDLRVENSQSLFTAHYDSGQIIRIPIAHHDGNYFADTETIDRLNGEGRVAFRYVGASGEPTEDDNPNGSRDNIAGIFNESKTVLGMMPHPERAADARHGGTDGKPMMAALAAAAGGFA